MVKSKYKKKKCNKCNKRRKASDKDHQICHVCYKTTMTIHKSGNQVIDDFIIYTQTNYAKKEGKLEFVPYNQFSDVEFIAEGGFSKIYKATWIRTNKSYSRQQNCTIVLKKLNDSKNITFRKLNELKIFYEFSLRWKAHRDRAKNEIETDDSLYKYYKYGSYNYICNYFGITQDPITQDIMIIMPYYKSGDLIHYVNEGFNNSWEMKLRNLKKIMIGLINIHSVDIIHRDLHSGNIFFGSEGTVVIGDLGISKSATDDDNNSENYGVIPYMAPEIFQRQNYTKASDIYSLGMIMWELMTGRRPFWDRNHDIGLIIEICTGLRPLIITKAPEGYIELMKECWHSDPKQRPTATEAYNKIERMYNNELKNVTKISVVKPVITNNPGAIYTGRPLSDLIQSEMSLRSLRSRSTKLEFVNNYIIPLKDETKFENNLIEENDDSGYRSREIEYDINVQSYDNGYKYVTKELDLDINHLK